MKKIFFSVLFLLLLFAIVACNSQDIESGGGASNGDTPNGDTTPSQSDDTTPSESQGLTYTFSSEDGFYTVTGGGVFTDDPLVIPAQYNGITVGAIQSEAFRSAKPKSISLPSSIVSIGEEAFLYAEKETVNGITYIGKWVIDCERTLTEVKLKEGVVGIADEAFQYCKSLESVTLPESIKYIGDFAFDHCEKLSTVKLGNSVVSIGMYAFANCPNLRSVNIPQSITSLGACVFKNSSNAVSVTHGISFVDGWIVGCERDVQELILPANTVGIGAEAFQDCTNIQEIILPNTLKYIGTKAFSKCSGVKKIFISESVEAIGYLAFLNCNAVTSFEIAAGNHQYSSIGNDLYSKDGTVLIRKIVKEKHIIIPDHVTEIGNGALGGFLFSSISIPNGVKVIGADAFASTGPDYGLSQINLPQSVTKIGERAFQNCTAFITLPSGLVLTEIEPQAFERSCLEAIEISSTVSKISIDAFKNCTSLQSITVSPENKNYKSIDGVLYNHDGTVLLKFPEGKKATSFVLPDKVRTIGQYAFEKAKIDTVTINEGATVIADHAFYYSQISAITISSSVTQIETYAFAQCDLLKNIHYNEKKDSWDAIQKGKKWIDLDSSSQYIVQCTDLQFILKQ